MSKRSVIFCAAGIAACAAAYIFSRLEFEHECQIDFLYLAQYPELRIIQETGRI